MEEFSLLGVSFACGSREELRKKAETLMRETRAAKSEAEMSKARKGRGACVVKELFPRPGLATEGVSQTAENDAKTSARDGAPYIVTPNAEITYRAYRNPGFSRLLAGAAMRLPDGVGVTLGARLFGGRLSRYPGIELAEELLAAAPPEGLRLFLLGGRPGVAMRAGASLSRRYPHIRIVGARHGYFPPEEEGRVWEEICTARPDLLFVCLGSPRQERWMAARPLPAPAIGLGGALDVWAGDLRRAPRLLRRAGLEWLWRLLSEPRRWRRTAALPRFLLALLRARLSLFAQNATKRRHTARKKRQM